MASKSKPQSQDSVLAEGSVNSDGSLTGVKVGTQVKVLGAKVEGHAHYDPNTDTVTVYGAVDGKVIQVENFVQNHNQGDEQGEAIGGKITLGQTLSGFHSQSHRTNTETQTTTHEQSTKMGVEKDLGLVRGEAEVGYFHSEVESPDEKITTETFHFQGALTAAGRQTILVTGVEGEAYKNTQTGQTSHTTIAGITLYDCPELEIYQDPSDSCLVIVEGKTTISSVSHQFGDPINLDLQQEQGNLAKEWLETDHPIAHTDAHEIQQLTHYANRLLADSDHDILQSPADIQAFNQFLADNP